MIGALKKIYKREMFQPKVIGLFCNPFYIIRYGLYKHIRNNAEFLSGKLLDFGCGSKPYKNLFNVEEYIGLDMDVGDAHSHNNEQIDVLYEGKEIPFESSHFDSIFCSEVFEHVFELEDTLKELNRVCKPGGYMLVTVPFIWDEHEVPYDFGRYTSFGIKYLLNKHSFKVIESFKTTNYIETLFQMWNAYVWQYILRYPVFQLIFTPLVIAPVTILGIIIAKILPQNDKFFHNNVLVVKKVI